MTGKKREELAVAQMVTAVKMISVKKNSVVHNNASFDTSASALCKLHDGKEEGRTGNN